MSSDPAAVATMLEELKALQAAPGPAVPVGAAPSAAAPPAVDEGTAELDTLFSQLEAVEAAKPRLPSTPGQIGRAALDSQVRGLASWNRGVIDLMASPFDLLDFAGTMAAEVGLTPQAVRTGAGDFIRRKSEQVGMTLPRGADQNWVERGLEITGNSTIPTVGLMKAGQAASKILPARRTVFQQMAAQAAERPGTTMTVEGIASASAAAGGEVARQFTDDPTIVGLSELTAGFAPAAISAMSPTGYLLRTGADYLDNARRQFGAGRRTSNALRDRVADPTETSKTVARNLESNPHLSPARASENAELMSVEQRLLEDSPQLEAAFGEQLARAAAHARGQALAFGGEPGRAGRILREGRDHILNALNINSSAASQRAMDEIAQLDGPSPGEIARVARGHLEGALNNARSTEHQLWSAVDGDLPAPPIKTLAAAEDEFARLTDFSRDRIPEVIGRPARAAEGEAAAVEGTGIFANKPRTLKELKDLRTQLLEDIRQEKARPDGNRQKIGVMNRLQEALLEDMSATGAEGIDTARAFSRALNDKFTRGAVGRIMGDDVAGGDRVAEGDTLNQIIGGRTSATAIEQMITPNVALPAEQAAMARQDITKFIQQRYLLETVGPDGNVNPQSAARFLKGLTRSRTFEVLPELQEQLAKVGSMQADAERLGVGAASARELMYNGSRYRAATYMDAPPGQEMDALLRANQPDKTARMLLNRIPRDDVAARNGLKTEFVDSLMRASERGDMVNGTRAIDGQGFNNLLDKYASTAKSLGIEGDELGRLRQIAKEFDLIYRRRPAAGQLFVDKPSRLLNVVARMAGASSGERIGKKLGGGQLVLASYFSRELQNDLAGMSEESARRLLVEAHRDPDLYRSFMTTPDDSPARQAWAAGRIRPYLFGIEVADTALEDEGE